MGRKSRVTALAEGHSAIGCDRNRDPQRDPLSLLCADPATVHAARRLAESLAGNPDRIATILLILRGRQEAQK